MQRRYYIYLMASRSGVLYTGMTNDLKRRVYQHKHKLISGFTSRYNVTRLVYFEEYDHPRKAIQREKEIKGWRREKKNALVGKRDPEWQDLSAGWLNEE